MPESSPEISEFRQMIIDAANDGTSDQDLLAILKEKGWRGTRQRIVSYRKQPPVIKKLTKPELLARDHEGLIRGGAGPAEVARQTGYNVHVVYKAFKLLGVESGKPQSKTASSPNYLVKDLSAGDYQEALTYQEALNSFPNTHELTDERTLPNGGWRIIFRKRSNNVQRQ